ADASSPGYSEQGSDWWMTGPHHLRTKEKNRKRFRKNEEFLRTRKLRMAQGSFGVDLLPRTLYIAIKASVARPLPWLKKGQISPVAIPVWDRIHKRASSWQASPLGLARRRPLFSTSLVQLGRRRIPMRVRRQSIGVSQLPLRL